MTADEFLKNIVPKPKGSKIEPYYEDILKLRRAGLSYNQILDFLRINGIVVTYSTLADYLRRHAPVELQGVKKPRNKSQNKEKAKGTDGSSSSNPITEPNSPASSSSSNPLNVFELKKPVKFDSSFLENDE